MTESRPISSEPGGPRIFGVDITRPQSEREASGIGLIVAIGGCPHKVSAPSDEPLAWHTPYGGSLAGLAMLSSAEYERRIDRVMLFPKYQEPWRFRAARQIAKSLIPGMRGRHVLLLGSHVASAFGVTDDHALFCQDRWGSRWWCFPQPSALSRWFLDKNNLADARKMLAILVGADISKRASIRST